MFPHLQIRILRYLNRISNSYTRPIQKIPRKLIAIGDFEDFPEKLHFPADVQVQHIVEIVVHRCRKPNSLPCDQSPWWKMGLFLKTKRKFWENLALFRCYQLAALRLVWCHPRGRNKSWLGAPETGMLALLAGFLWRTLQNKGSNTQQIKQINLFCGWKPVYRKQSIRATQRLPRVDKTKDNDRREDQTDWGALFRRVLEHQVRCSRKLDRD